jgi:hypothetical protein
MLFSLLNTIQWLTAAFKIKYKLLHGVNKTQEALLTWPLPRRRTQFPNIEKIMLTHFLVPSPIFN